MQVYRAMEKGLITNRNEQVRRLIEQGIARMDLFFHNGLFSLWEGGSPDTGITTQVLRNLVPFREWPSGNISSHIGSAVDALKREKMRDNRLVPYGNAFASPMKTVRDAAILYKANIDRKKAYRIVMDQAVTGNDTAFWNDSTCWAQATEATCYALQVLSREGHRDLFQRGLTYLSRRMQNGILHSTSDTCAFLELMMGTAVSPTPQAQVEGKRISIAHPCMCTHVEAIDEVLAKADREEEIDFLKPADNFRAELRISRQELEQGEKGMLEIIPREESIAPLVRIYLPGNIAPLIGGAAAQKLYLPLKGGSLKLEFYAIRRGKGAIHSVIHDMYDAEKVGVLPEQVVTVK